MVLLALSEDSPLHLARRRSASVRSRPAWCCSTRRLSPDDLLCARQAGADVMLPCSHGLDALMSVLDRCADQVAGQDRPPAPAALTETEREILTLLGAGQTVRDIAGLLRTTANEVENAKRRIYQRLDVSTGSQAVARAVALGLIEHHPPGRRPTRRHRPTAPRSSSSGAPMARRCSRW